SVPSGGEGKVPAATTSIEWAVGGCGGAYFLASPGKLVIDVHKQDRNRSRRRTELRAILVSPDRRVIQEAIIPAQRGEGREGLGPVQWARLETQVDRKGIYALNVTVSQDRYGDDFVWGFQTNCEHYLVETARGHRDQRHEEPIVLMQPDRDGNVCFLPRQGEFAMEIGGLAPSVGPLKVLDGNDRLIVELQADANHQIAHTFPAGESRDAVPWRIHFPVLQGVVNMDGLTRWEAADDYPNLACWTPDARSWFDLLPNRWLVTPYRRTVYAAPGTQGETAFRIHNNARRRRTIQLALEFADGPWPATVSSSQVEIPGRSAVEVQVRYTAPPLGESRLCHLRATPIDSPAVSTYATVICIASEAPAAETLDMPLVLKPYEHENEQLGYVPDYPVEYEMYFDPANRPYTRAGTGVATMRDGAWTTTNLAQSVTRRSPPFDGGFSPALSKIAFDSENNVYLLARTGPHVAMLRSSDNGQSYEAFLLPEREDRSSSFDVEQFSGHNTPAGPPPILRYTLTAVDPNVFWRRVNDLELILAEKQGNQIVFQEPILISDKCIGLAAHSGIPATVVSRGDRVHVVWGEATDPAIEVPGVPTYAATYDRKTKQLSKPALVAYGPPANDVHNSPSMTQDSKGYLHVLAGTHGRPFPYAQSVAPNDAGAGWTEAVLLGDNLRQTYIGMVCDPDDTLHIIYRLWRSGEEPHPASTHAVLAHQRKPAGGPWQVPEALIVPPFSEYGVFYHRLTIDRLGRLFVSYDYWSTHWFYRNDHVGSRRALMMSPDGAATWRMATKRDLRP
ncbi:MAG: BNR-4 repeat-containing protein, partial [Patescibacteria group bacterium]|nr:BNR-4 repeat-containing protein [Patescibacteria group bacterium]